MAAFVQDITEAIRADNRASVDDYSPPDASVSIKHDIREKASVLAYLTFCANVVICHQHGAGAETAPRSNETTGPDVSRSVNLR